MEFPDTKRHFREFPTPYKLPSGLFWELHGTFGSFPSSNSQQKLDLGSCLPAESSELAAGRLSGSFVPALKVGDPMRVGNSRFYGAFGQSWLGELPCRLVQRKLPCALGVLTVHGKVTYLAGVAEGNGPRTHGPRLGEKVPHTHMSKTKHVVPSKATATPVTVAMLAAIKVGDVERLPLASVMTATNYSRPGWNPLAPTGYEALADHMEAVGQMNPCLVMTGEGGKVILVAGNRRHAALKHLHAKGKHDGTILVRRVTVAPGADLPASAVAPLVNLMENEDAKRPTGLAGRLAVYDALRKAELSTARIAALTGQSAIDYVADTLRLTEPGVDPRFRYAVEAFEDERDAFSVTVAGKDKDGKDAQIKVKGQAAPFGLVRLIVRAPEFHNGTEAEAGDRYTAWEVFRKVAHLSVAKATPLIASMKAGRAAVAKAEAEAEAQREAQRLQREAEREGRKGERGMENKDSTKAADDFRETAATLTVPVLLEIRSILAADKPNVAKALDVIKHALSDKGGAFVKAYGAAYVDEAIEAAS